MSTFTVTIRDTQSPIITCNDTIILSTSPGASTATELNFSLVIVGTDLHPVGNR